MPEKRIKPCVTTVCAPKRDPLNVRAQMSRAGVTGGSANVVGPSGPGPEMLVGRRNIDAFWEALPWGDSQVYFSREAYITVPGVAGETLIDAFTIQRGMALALTSVVFRTSILFQPNHDTFLRDDYFIGRDNATGATAFFEPRISSRGIVDRAFWFNTVNTTRSGFALLNTDIATTEVPFVIFAHEGQTVTCSINMTAQGLANLALMPNARIGVEWGGMWLPKKLHDQLREKFNG